MQLLATNDKRFPSSRMEPLTMQTCFTSSRNSLTDSFGVKKNKDLTTTHKEVEQAFRGCF